MQQAGVTELFARIAAEAVRVFGVETDYVHLDTSSFSLHGEYQLDMAQRVVEVKHGYSKEQRPDLIQAVVTLITSQASALSVWLEVLDGNSSDKQSFQQTVQSYCRHLEDASPRSL